MQKIPEIGGNHQGAMSNYIKITRKRKTGVGKDSLSSVYFIYRKVCLMQAAFKLEVCRFSLYNVQKGEEEMKGNHRNKARAFLFIVIIGAFLAVGIWLVGDIQEKEKSAREYAEITENETKAAPSPAAKTRVPETEPEKPPYVSPIDFEALRAINQDVIGWIRIPDTPIDYPILQGEDNEQYLHTDIEGNDSVAGAIYLDFEDEPDFSSLHNILYGHHMKNGTMFKTIVYYKEQDFFDQHRDIYIYTPEREIHLKAFAALYTSADGIRRRTRFYSGRALDDYVRKMTEGAMVKVTPEGPVNKLYSLITCSYEFTNARTVLYAYEVEE